MSTVAGESSRSERLHAALLELARSEPAGWGATLSQILEVDADALDVTRVSMWLYDPNGQAIVCEDLFDRSRGVHERGARLEEEAFPGYFEALSQTRVIAASDACEDPATSELAESYLRPLGIASMLDVPVWHRGQVAGVVCHEHRGDIRTWTVEEQDFAASVADLVGRALEAHERQSAETALHLSETRFKAIFDQSPVSLLLVSTDGRPRQVNAAYERLFGLKLEDLRDFNLLTYSRLEDEGMMPLVRKAFEGEPSIVPPLFHKPYPDAPGRWIQGVLYPIKDDAGRVLEVIVVHQDVTDLKEAEEVSNRAKDELERRVEERTAELARANEALAAEIAERTRAQESLQRREERFRLLFENVSDIITILGADGTLQFHSPSAVRINGYSDEETLGKSSLSFIHPDDLPHVRSTLAQVVANPGEEFVATFRFRHKDGHWIWFESIARTLSPNGADDGILVNSRDVTERKATQEALQRSEEHFRNLTENSSDVVTIIDRDSKIQYTSSAMGRIFGYAPEDVLGRCAFDFFHPADVETARANLGNIVENPGATHSAEFRFRHKDGHYLYCDAAARTLVPDSAEEGIVVNTRDITARKEAEERQREAEERARLIIDTALDAVVAIDAEGRITHWNAQAEATFGWTREEAIGHRMSELMVPHRLRDSHDTGLQRYLDTRIETVLNRRIEVVALDRNGREFPVELTVTPVEYAGGLTFNAFIRDITERRQAEADLEAAKAAAEAANLAKNEFLSRMSHELRTPMNSILGFAQLLERKGLPADGQRSVGHILKAGRHLLNLINEVLDIARIEANHLQLSLEPVDVRGIVTEAVTLIRPQAGGLGVRIHDDGMAACPHYVRADRQRLTQVLLNLLSNAVKYNVPGGTVRVSCTVEPDGAAPEGSDVGQLWIHVEDTGIGVAPEQIERLFVPFERLGAERSGVEGTGLGLPLAKRLVEAMGGTLNVTSAPGAGSTFSIGLALADSPLKGLERTTPGEDSVGAADEHEEKALILYIEDNLANLSLIETILTERPGITLLSALQGQLGLQLAYSHRPDVILLDLHLPDIQGDEVLRHLKNDPRTKDTPVVIISADATPGRVDRLRQSGARAYLTKPLDVVHFLNTVDELVKEVVR